jgi:hypothetical protein
VLSRGPADNVSSQLEQKHSNARVTIVITQHHDVDQILESATCSSSLVLIICDVGDKIRFQEHDPCVPLIFCRLHHSMQVKIPAVHFLFQNSRSWFHKNMAAQNFFIIFSLPERDVPRERFIKVRVYVNNNA